MFMPKRPIFTPERISASPDSSVPQKVVWKNNLKKWSFTNYQFLDYPII